MPDDYYVLSGPCERCDVWDVWVRVGDPRPSPFICEDCRRERASPPSS
jgi:hypothetical protein